MRSSMLRARRSRGLSFAALVAAMAVVGGGLAASTTASSTEGVVVERGAPVQIAFTAATEFPEFSAAFENAIRLAIEQHPAIRGFPVQLNVIETTCGGDNEASAASIVANAQNTAVIGHLCSAGFTSALPVYEAAGLVTLSGSATADELPQLGPTVFNRTIVRDGDDVDRWMSDVLALPSVEAWSLDYEARFGVAPPELAVFYFDAASLLLRRLQQHSEIADRSLVVNRAELATAVRQTTRFQGITCTVSLDPATGNRVNDTAALARCGAD
jgi:ABC-type branched-subunit amino acid transport system substrate-binding protein